MKKMIPAALCMVSLAAASLTGCSLNSETAQNLADEVTANTSAVHSASVNIDMNMDLDYESAGISIPLSYNAQMSGNISRDPSAAHLTGTITASSDIGSSKNEEEIYSLTDSGTKTIYTGSDGNWYQTVQEISGSKQDLISDSGLCQLIADADLHGVLEEDSRTVDGRECYVIDTAISGDTLRDVMEEYLTRQDLYLDDVDWSDVSADAAICIYKDTKLPARISLDSDFSNPFSIGSSDSTAVAHLKAFNIEYTFSDYGTAETVSIPQNIIDTAGSAGAQVNYLNGNWKQRRSNRLPAASFCRSLVAAAFLFSGCPALSYYGKMVLNDHYLGGNSYEEEISRIPLPCGRCRPDFCGLRFRFIRHADAADTGDGDDGAEPGGRDCRSLRGCRFGIAHAEAQHGCKYCLRRNGLSDQHEL